MKTISLVILLTLTLSIKAQVRKVVLLGSSTTAGLATSSPDSSWAKRFNFYYKYQSGVLDTTYNLGVSGTNLYAAMPNGFTPPAGRPAPDPLHNVSLAHQLLSDLPSPDNGVVIINFPSGGYDTYTISEIMSLLQVQYDSVTRTGNHCFITTTQPRTDAGFNTSVVKRKLADIKDSIIQRFGVAHTINFWDDMYNPVDTTILPAYSAGDNVHFNNAGHRILFERVRAKNVFNLPPVNYRSNVAPTGLWSDISSWQVFNGSSWVTATMAPSSGSGTITIQSGDSIRINSFTELDQLVIESSATLSVFNTATMAKAVATINDGPGDDLVNNGKLYISANGILNGDGQVGNNSGGLFTLRNRGILEATTSNAGTLYVSGTGIVRNRTITNNKTFVLQDFTLNLVKAAFINNDSVSITGSGTTFIADSTLAGGVFTNTSTGVICRHSTAGITNFNTSVLFTNMGRIKGPGSFVVYNAAPASVGSIEPGNVTGLLTINPALVSITSSHLKFEITGTGAVAGTNYDKLNFSAVSPVAKNISNTTLTVTDNADDPVGTVYTIITTDAGTIGGNFANVNLSPSLTGPFYNGGNYITVIKGAILPLQWGGFSAIIRNRDVELKWTTLHESNTKFFEIEHGLNGQHFSSVGQTPARGYASATTSYEFIHSPAEDASKHFYRVKQVDNDGRMTYSTVQEVTFQENVAGVIGPNPVLDRLRVYVESPGQLSIYDLAGKERLQTLLKAGINWIDVQSFSKGRYFAQWIKDGRVVQSWQLIKQ